MGLTLALAGVLVLLHTGFPLMYALPSAVLGNGQMQPGQTLAMIAQRLWRKMAWWILWRRPTKRSQKWIQELFHDY